MGRELRGQQRRTPWRPPLALASCQLVSRNAHDFLRLGPSAGRNETSTPNFQARARALMVLERPGVKQPAASQPTAAGRPQRRRSCFGSRFDILSMMPAHLNNGWRTTAVDVPAALGALSTPTPTPSPDHLSPSLPCPDRLPRCCSPDQSSGHRRQPDRPTGGGADPAGRCERPGGRGAAGRRAVGGASVVLLGRGGASGAAAVPGPRRALVGVLGGLYGLCCHIISLPNLNHAQTMLGRGLGQRDA